MAHDGAGNIENALGVAEAMTTAPSNSPPIIAQVATQSIIVGQNLAITNHVQSPSPVIFSLASGAPSGAAVTTNGVFSWTPECIQGSTTNAITIVAANTGNPPYTNSMTFEVVVGQCVQVSVGSTVMQVGTTSSIPVNLITTVGLTNLSFALAYPTNRFTNWSITASNSAISASTVLTVNPSQTLFSVITSNGQTLQGPTVVGRINLSALAGPSAFIPLTITNVSGVKSDSTSVGNATGQAGRIVIIGSQPLLEAWMSNSTRMLTLYGNPGSSYQLAFKTNLMGTNWQNSFRVPMTNVDEFFSVNRNAPQIFYEAWEFFADPPILELNPPLGTNATLLLYGRRGTNYSFQESINLDSTNSWLSVTNIIPTNSFQFIGIGNPTNTEMFFRAFHH